MSSTTAKLIAMVALLAPAIASAADPIDMKGRWVGKTHAIVAGHGGHYPASTATMSKPGLYEKDLVWEVTGQQDNRFWGKVIVSQGTERSEEPFVAQVAGKDGKKIVLADTDGYLWGDIDGDTVNFCYAQAAAPFSMVSCSEVKRAR
jgi:hypothetical protein